YFYIMNLVAVNLHLRYEIIYFTIDTNFQVTFLPDIFKQFAVMTFSTADQRSEQRNLLPGKFLVDILHDLFFAEFYHFLARIVAVRFGSTCKKKPHEIIDLRDRTHC